MSWSNWANGTLHGHKPTKVTVFLYGELVDANEDGFENTMV
jgi:hypothetical protein